MAKYIIEDTTLYNIGNAIRTQSRTTGSIKPGDMADAILALDIAPIAFLQNMTDYRSSIATDITPVRYPLSGLCTNLQTVTLDAATVIRGFNDLPNLTTVNAPAAIELWGTTFCNCYNLSVLNLPKVESASAACFKNCTSLTAVDLPSFTYALPSNCFYNCTNLTTADYPNATSVQDRCFYNCTNLTTVNLKSIEVVRAYAFENCTSLTTLDLPATAYYFEDSPFKNCSNLEHLILRYNGMITVKTTNTLSTDSQAKIYFFQGTPIASGTGYLYVPKTMVSTYQDTGYWGTIIPNPETQIRAIEDYPDITGG